MTVEKNHHPREENIVEVARLQLSTVIRRKMKGRGLSKKIEKTTVSPFLYRR
jgi:hypothetical protein